MKAIGVAGRSDAGKTSLIERLVPALRDDGPVATVKSIHHDVEIDEAGKDTYRHRRAGAERVVGVTPSLTFSVRARGKDDHPDGSDGALDRVLRDLAREEYAYALVEGFTGSRLPTIAVGDVPDGEIGGRILARVPDGESADVDRLVRGIRRVDSTLGEEGR